jgi:hypothetical protein
VAAGLTRQKEERHMKKLSFGIVVLAAAVVFAAPLTRHQKAPSAPATIQSDFPIPSCPPACALPTPSQIPN